MDRDGTAPIPPTEPLLAELGWIRSLARSLASGQADADDLAQEAWLRAATHPPRDPRLLRPWLRKVLANLAAFGGRSSLRRARREAASASDATAAPADELLARAQLQHTVASLVLALDEPYRSTLLLRYFDGLPAAEIARRQKVPAATVRWRLARALADLRTELDRRSGGDRRAWAALLLPSERLWPWMKGALLMKPPVKVTFSLVLALSLVGTGIWWVGQKPGPGASPPPAARATAFAPARQGASGFSVPLPDWFAQVGVGPRRIAGRVLADERPVEGATVELADALTDTGAVALQVRRTDSRGRFDFGLQAAARREVIAWSAGSAPALARVELQDPSTQPAPDQLVLRLRDCGAPVFGVVSDVSGGPLASAWVCHAASGQPRACSTTDPEGRYRLCIERDGAANLRIGAAGYGAILDRIHPHSAPLRRNFALTPHAVVAGTVVRDRDGQPVPAARVSAEPRHSGAAAPAVTLTDEQGRFVLGGMAPGQYQIGASGGETASAHSIIDVMLGGAGARSDVTLRLHDTATVSGVVVSNGAPVAGVQLQMISQMLSWSISATAVSQRDGTFVLKEVAPGLNELRSPSHEVSSGRVINVAGTALTGVKVEVAAPAVVRGRVLRRGRPVPDALVSSGRVETRSDERGAFELAVPARGTHTIHATTIRASGTAQVLLRAGAVTEVDLVLDRAAAISGVLLEADGRPAPGLIVVFARTQGRDFSMGTSAEDGAFTVTRLVGHGTYVPRVQVDLSAPAKLPPAPGTTFPQVLLADGESHVRGVKLVIQRQHLTISGTVVDGTGAPRPDVEVSAVGLDGQGAARFDQTRVYPRATSTADGHFDISELDQGSFLLHARSGDGSEVELRGVRSGARGVVLRLPATGAIAGKLVGFRAPPEVIATPAGPSPRQLRATVTGGSFRLTHLVPGEYRVAALSPEAAAVTVVVPPGSTAQITIAARGRATVRGRVFELPTRRPVAGLTCSVLLDGASPEPRLRLPGGTVTDESGRFELAAPPGRPAVECRGPAGAISNGATVLALEAGQEVDVAIPVVRPRLPHPLAGKLIAVDLERTLMGARLASVVPGGPAERAGLRAGDTLLAIDGTSVDGLTQGGILMLIYDRAVGERASVTFARAGQQLLAEVTVASPAD